LQNFKKTLSFEFFHFVSQIIKENIQKSYFVQWRHVKGVILKLNSKKKNLFSFHVFGNEVERSRLSRIEGKNIFQFFLRKEDFFYFAFLSMNKKVANLQLLFIIFYLSQLPSIYFAIVP
jgi:hypothetical protein